MRVFNLKHLSDAALVRRLTELVVRDRVITATLLAHIAEVDARRLYVPAGFPSMHAYCVGALHFSDGAAYKRIHAARAARDFPALFVAVAEGRLHLTAVCLLAPHLTVENAEELMAAAEHRRGSEVEQFLADRFPLSGFAPAARTAASIRPLWTPQLPARAVDIISPTLALGLTPESEATATGVDAEPESAAPPTRFSLRVTIDAQTHDKLRRAQALLGHAVPSGDVAQVLDRALGVLIERLEKRKFAATTKPRRRQRQSANAERRARRCIPADVRRVVWERDQGQCTFVGWVGRRCPARKLLEFDHVVPVARGGRATVDQMRLRCRAHNQFEAERVFGVQFMRGKRAAAQARLGSTAARGAPGTSVAGTSLQTLAASPEDTHDVITALRALGLRTEEARRAAELTQSWPAATIEDRVLAALRSRGPRHVYGIGSGRPWAPAPGHAP